jgi:hypothetical protein
MSEAGETVSAEQLVDELRKAKVSDLLLHTCSLFASFGYGKLSPEARDLEQARLAIESLRVLVPVLKGTVPDEVTRDFEQLVSNMQLAYAKAAAG